MDTIETGTYIPVAGIERLSEEKLNILAMNIWRTGHAFFVGEHPEDRTPYKFPDGLFRLYIPSYMGIMHDDIIQQIEAVGLTVITKESMRVTLADLFLGEKKQAETLGASLVRDLPGTMLLPCGSGVYLIIYPSYFTKPVIERMLGTVAVLGFEALDPIKE